MNANTFESGMRTKGHTGNVDGRRQVMSSPRGANQGKACPARIKGWAISPVCI